MSCAYYKINSRGLGISIYTPKEKNSKHLEQFQPISLVNAKDKLCCVYFGLIQD